jgi:hypothetical protein
LAFFADGFFAAGLAAPALPAPGAFAPDAFAPDASAAGLAAPLGLAAAGFFAAFPDAFAPEAFPADALRGAFAPPPAGAAAGAAGVAHHPANRVGRGVDHRSADPVGALGGGVGGGLGRILGLARALLGAFADIPVGGERRGGGGERRDEHAARDRIACELGGATSRLAQGIGDPVARRAAAAAFASARGFLGHGSSSVESYLQRNRHASGRTVPSQLPVS